MPHLLGMLASPRFQLYQVQEYRPCRLSVRHENVEIGQFHAAVAALLLDQRTIALQSTLVRHIILHIVDFE